MNKLVICIAACVVAAPLAWLAGEQHRDNCIHQGHVQCSVLPWDNGNPRYSNTNGRIPLVPLGPSRCTEPDPIVCDLDRLRQGR